MNASLDDTGLMDDPPGKRRAFVLIPGAGGAAWYWHRVVPLLQEAGHEAIAVDLPGDDPAAGLPEYTDLVTSAISDRGNVVLVAQSLGGFTAPLVAAKVPLGSLIFVNAMIPAPGETPGQWWDNTGWAQARVAAAEKGGYDTEFDLAAYFLHDVPPEIAAAGETHQRPEADPGSSRIPGPVLSCRLPASASPRPAGHRDGRTARRPPDRPLPASQARQLSAQRLMTLAKPGVSARTEAAAAVHRMHVLDGQ